MRAHFLAYQEQQIHYCVWGRGPQLLIAIPGYADQAINYGFLEKVMGQDHTILAIDLPGHGKTNWTSLRFDLHDFKNIIEALLLKTGFDRFKLMGHSFGGRVVLCLIQYFQQQIDFVYLLAPDGLKSWDLKYSPLLPSIFRRGVGRLIRYPAPLLSFAGLLHRLALLPSSSHRFLHVYLKTPVQRARLLLFWNSLLAFRIKPQNLHRALSSSHFTFAIIFGKKDRIISPALGEKWSNSLPNVDFYLIEGNHFILGETLGDQLAEINATLK